MAPPAPSPAPPPALVGYPYAEPPPWFYYRPPKPPIGFGRPPAPGGNPYAAPPPGVPVKPPIGFGRPPAPPIVSPSPKRIGFELPEEPPPPTQPRPTINQTRRANCTSLTTRVLSQGATRAHGRSRGGVRQELVCPNYGGDQGDQNGFA